MENVAQREPAAESELLNERDAAKFLGGVSQKHMFNLRKRGVLPFLKLGERIMYSRPTLKKWIAKHETSEV